MVIYNYVCVNIIEGYQLIGRWINWLDIQESYVWKTQIKNGELENLIYMNVALQLF